jgi:hypothetical protein
MSRLSKSQAYLAFGSEIVNEAMETDKEPTSRLMYPSFENPSHLGKDEYAGEPIEIDGRIITAYYYLTSDDIDNIDSYDWESSVEFEVEEIF